MEPYVWSGDLRLPDAIEPIVACRLWRACTESTPILGELPLRTRPPHLHSLAKSTRWPVSEALVATCVQDGPFAPLLRQEEHGRIPCSGCGCGVWGLADPSFLAPYRTWNRTAVVGLVRLWGRVVCGTLGWRAEFGLPAAIVATGAPAEEEVAEAYGLPLLENWPTLTPPIVTEEVIHGHREGATDDRDRAA